MANSTSENSIFGCPFLTNLPCEFVQPTGQQADGARLTTFRISVVLFVAQTFRSLFTHHYPVTIKKVLKGCPLRAELV
jgi:hypothetical protein